MSLTSEYPFFCFGALSDQDEKQLGQDKISFLMMQRTAPSQF